MINGRAVNIMMMENVVDIIIFKSIFWDETSEVINVTSYHPIAHKTNNCFMTDLKFNNKRWASSTTM
jgi:5,10-methenyltetrahydromethanopterin hydrogenase